MSRLVFALVLAGMLLSFPARAAEGDYVILFHGIARTNGSMESLAEALRKEGYEVLNVDYPSRNYSLRDLADKLDPDIAAFTRDRKKRVHFVGHSMGGLLIRTYIQRHRPRRLGRVVMMGTPNSGSEVADILHDSLIFQGYYGPAGQELRTGRKNDLLLGKINYELGVIAGDRSIDPVSSYYIPGPDDGKVSVESTKAKGMKDHIVLHATHTFMMKQANVIRQTLHFLAFGKFHHPRS
jgi:triacylglycerol lipase